MFDMLEPERSIFRAELFVFAFIIFFIIREWKMSTTKHEIRTKTDEEEKEQAIKRGQRKKIFRGRSMPLSFRKCVLIIE